MADKPLKYTYKAEEEYKCLLTIYQFLLYILVCHKHLTASPKPGTAHPKLSHLMYTVVLTLSFHKDQALQNASII